jgi:hypothetical protein
MKLSHLHELSMMFHKTLHADSLNQILPFHTFPSDVTRFLSKIVEKFSLPATYVSAQSGSQKDLLFPIRCFILLQ